MLNRISLVSISLLACAALPLPAQTPPSAAAGSVAERARTTSGIALQAKCESGSSVTSLGFTFAARLTRRYSGSGTMSSARGAGGAQTNSSAISYEDEPLVGNVNEDGPAAGKIRPGDLIARVNGYAITSPEGAAALSSAKPGTSLVLTVRRGENLVPVTIIPTGVRCPMMLGGTYAPSVSGYSTARIAPSVVAGGQLSKLTPGTAALAQSGSLVRAVNGGWLGIGFDCQECGQRVQGNGRVWYFSEAPVIYNVDTGSPAYNAGIRRGDVLLRVDGKDITTSAAGARLGQVKPGESLKLTYRRGSRTTDATLRVAQSPVALRSSSMNAIQADEFLKSTKELRASATTEARLRELLTQTDVAKAKQDATIRELETALQANRGNENARAVLNKLRATQDAQARNQERILTELLRNQEAEARKLSVIEQQMKRASEAPRLDVIEMPVIDSAARTSLSRDQKLRYSGSVGGADVEVRGPGSVNVQGDGDDLLIITGDAIIRIKARKIR